MQTHVGHVVAELLSGRAFGDLSFGWTFHDSGWEGSPVCDYAGQRSGYEVLV